MNRCRSLARRRAAPPFAHEARGLVEELKEERRLALVRLQDDMGPAERALLAKVAEAQAALARHREVYRTRRSEVQTDFAGRIDAVRRASAAGIAVARKVPS